MVGGSFHLRVRMIDPTRGVTQTANFTDPRTSYNSIHFPVGFIGGASSGMGEIHVRAPGNTDDCKKVHKNATKMPSVTTLTQTIMGTKPSSTKPPSITRVNISTTYTTTPAMQRSPSKKPQTTRTHQTSRTVSTGRPSTYPLTSTRKTRLNPATFTPGTTGSDEAETDSAGETPIFVILEYERDYFDVD